MANWYGTSRSNYFRVKDPDAFLAWTKLRGLNAFTKPLQPDVFAVYPDDSGDDGSWPSYDLDSDTEIAFEAELALHLAKGEIAVLMQAGAEKLRYVNGVAIAVNAKGRIVALTLDDIYGKAARSFRVPEARISRAEY